MIAPLTLLSNPVVTAIIIIYIIAIVIIVVINAYKRFFIFLKNVFLRFFIFLTFLLFLKTLNFQHENNENFKILNIKIEKSK